MSINPATCSYLAIPKVGNHLMGVFRLPPEVSNELTLVNDYSDIKPSRNSNRSQCQLNDWGDIERLKLLTRLEDQKEKVFHARDKPY